MNWVADPYHESSNSTKSVWLVEPTTRPDTKAPGLKDESEDRRLETLSGQPDLLRYGEMGLADLNLSTHHLAITFLAVDSMRLTT